MSEIAAWTPIATDQIEFAAALGDRIHLDYPEDLSVFRRRFELYPRGFFVLNEGAVLAGYAVFHPWKFGSPPLLNAYLDILPENADCLHLHDIVLVENYRGRGHAAGFMQIMSGQAIENDFSQLTLVAVTGTEPIWRRFGFQNLDFPSAQTACRSYSETSIYMGKKLG